VTEGDGVDTARQAEGSSWDEREKGETMARVIVCARDPAGDTWVRQEGEFERVPVVGEYIGDPETLAWHPVIFVAHVPSSRHTALFVPEVFVGKAENPSSVLDAGAAAADK
jgi:hypothetical protein